MSSVLVDKRDTIIHYMMVWNGGLMGGYAMLLRDNFGSAMTGNLMQLMVDVSLSDFSMIASRLGALCIYFASFMISTVLKNHSKVDMKRLVPVVVIIGMLIASAIPVTPEINPIVALYPMFFISAFQWNTFAGAEGYAASTIFISNNTRQSACAWAEYLCSKDAAYKKRAIFYTCTVVLFVFGVFVDCCLSIMVGQYAILIGIVPMVLTELMLARIPD